MSDLRFVAAIATHADFHALNDVLAYNPAFAEMMRAVLLSPLVAQPGIFRMAKEARERYGIPVMFDSGGYQVQSGVMTYPDLLSRLGDCVTAYPWADLYVMPDHVPKSEDDLETVERKVCDTIRESVRFYQELPAELKSRALAVVQGRTWEQMTRCLDAYREAGITHVGFGGFATGGKGGTVNIFTQDVMTKLDRLASEIEWNGQTLHVFGIGSVRWLPFLGLSAIASFDTTGMFKSAGFGWAYLPMTGRYAVGKLDATPKEMRSARERFVQARCLTGHCCPWCQEVENLVDKKARARHNLVAHFEALDLVQQEKFAKVSEIFLATDRAHYKRWRNYYEPPPQQLELFTA